MKAKGVLIEYNSTSGVLKLQLMTESRREMMYHFEKHKTAVHQFDIAKWYKKKSTGPESANNHSWGHSRQIAQEIGDDPREILREACLRTPEYPSSINKLGVETPQYWGDANSKEAAAVIETLHRIASFLSIRLIEKKWGEE